MNDEQFFGWLRRQGKEPSKAAESKYYGDPARSVRLKGEGMRGQELHNFCLRWADWCRTRRFYVPPGAASQKNVLARFQPSKASNPPDAELSSDIYWFNMALHALADMADPDLECFVRYYWNGDKDIKAVAHKMGIHRDTFYARKTRIAERGYGLALSLRRAHAAMTAECVHDTAED